jgi:predicted metalloprotease
MVRFRRPTMSGNVEDRRGAGVPGSRVRIPGGAAGAGGIGGIIILIVLVAAALMGVDLGPVTGGGPTGPGGGASSLTPEEEQALATFSSQVLADTEATWSAVFAEDLGRTYTPPTLVLFTGYVESACGQASAAVGPFYCPADGRIYLDLAFFHDLHQEFGAPGDFAQAYVIAHEVGHHVQTLLGTTRSVAAAQQRAASQAEANRLSVALELQADCYAGVWANRGSERNLILEPGDVEEGLTAASAIGDDRLQQQSQGYVVPDAFTHGSSAQRVACFRNGLENGDVGLCDCGGLPSG